MKKSNIILIGMPGSGKSTVGVTLAKLLAKRFLDTDILIQNREKKTLQEIIDDRGHLALRQIEEEVLLSVSCKGHVIATGGSAAYSDPAMVHLKKDGITVYLQASLEALRSRITNYETRGVARRPGQSFQELFEEREKLYNHYADIAVESSNLTQDEVSDIIASRLSVM
ncbi:shikimate kinase [Desulforhopalus singaporensis]|uniref:Shikimate kinase n=1 Tax=Desulforhopalus singaporensis TaxID=91360 RepID=A0A1H0PDH7_9BACT|nr:shikimate kinase [Desulforhopalus singaporensis]SDP02666.1 shikimate kinase [Desulforhopalus singaporensis]